MPDISLYQAHEWYDFVYWVDLSDGTEKLGRWLGPCGDRFGGGDCHWILNEAAMPVSTNTVRAVTEEEWRSHDVKRYMDSFDQAVESKIGDKLENTDVQFQDMCQRN